MRLLFELAVLTGLVLELFAPGNGELNEERNEGK